MHIFLAHTEKRRLFNASIIDFLMRVLSASMRRKFTVCAQKGVGSLFNL